MSDISPPTSDRNVAPEVSGQSSQAQDTGMSDFEQHLAGPSQAPSAQSPDLDSRLAAFERNGPKSDRATFEADRRQLQDEIEDNAEAMGSGEYDAQMKRLKLVFRANDPDRLPWFRPVMQQPLSPAQQNQAAEVRQRFASLDPRDRGQHEQIHQSAIQAYQHPDASPASILPAYETDRAVDKFLHHHPNSVGAVFKRISSSLNNRVPTDHSVRRVLDATNETPNGSIAAATLRTHQPTLDTYQRHQNDIVGTFAYHHGASIRAREQSDPDPS